MLRTGIGICVGAFIVCLCGAWLINKYPRYACAENSTGKALVVEHIEDRIMRCYYVDPWADPKGLVREVKPPKRRQG